MLIFIYFLNCKIRKLLEFLSFFTKENIFIGSWVIITELFLSATYLSSDSIKYVEVFVRINLFITLSQKHSVNFTNIFTLRFYARRSQKRKKTYDLTVFFTLLGSVSVKMYVERSWNWAIVTTTLNTIAEVDFINISD